MFWVGVVLLVLFVGLAFFISFKPWKLTITAPSYSMFPNSRVLEKNFSEIVPYYIHGITKVKIDIKDREVSMNIVLPKPDGCIILNGETFVLTGSSTFSSKYYDKSVLSGCIKVDSWDKEHLSVMKTMLANGILPVSIIYDNGIYEVEAMRKCGLGLIKVTTDNLDKVSKITKYWPDCRYKEYRLLYDTGAVLR
jgi:hypothetical protein